MSNIAIVEVPELCDACLKKMAHAIMVAMEDKATKAISEVLERRD